MQREPPAAAGLEEDEVGDAGGHSLRLHDRGLDPGATSAVRDGEKHRGVLPVLETEPRDAVALQLALLVGVRDCAGFCCGFS